MNDPLGLEASGLPPELVAQLMGSSKRRAIAEAMLRQAMQAPEVQQPKGRFQGVVSPLEHIAKLTQGVLARGDMRAADDERAAIGRQAESGRKAAMEAYMKQKLGAPEVAYTDTLGSEPPQAPISPGVKADPRGALAAGFADPYLKDSKFLQMEQGSLDKAEAREDQQAFLSQQAKQAAADRAANLAAQLESRAAEVKMRLEDKALDRASREMLMRSQQEIQRELGLARAEAAKAAAQSRIDAQTEKANAKKEQQDKAKEMVSGLLNELSDYYDELKGKGAAIDTTKSGPANAYASLRASPVGQMVGGAVGTEEQTVRDKIKQTSPMLMNAIRQATAMGARGLDSNAELKFYLQAVTDPAKSIQFNKAALKILDTAYGLGMGVKGVDDKDVSALKAEFQRSRAPAESAQGGFRVLGVEGP